MAVAIGFIPCPTSQVLECIDASEFQALTTNQKDAVRIILSCGTVNMAPDSVIYKRLIQLFPSGNTHDDITERCPEEMTA